MTDIWKKRSGAFGSLVPQAADGLLTLISQFAADPRSNKIDLGVGVFRDEAGFTPIMRAVKMAERELAELQDSKSYLGADGDVGFTERLRLVALGEKGGESFRTTGVQTPGGTGALRLGAELIASASPGANVWMGEPTWANHAPIFAAAGLSVQLHRYFERASLRIDFEGMVADLRGARAGDLVLLHGCCHNPTGASPTAPQWKALADLCAERGLIPFLDLAYQGLGDGLTEDAGPTRLLLDAVPEALVAYSCDKNFGLYRERVGALWVQAETASDADLARENILALARSLWSMPPGHGAATVRTVLESRTLTADWKSELLAMRDRLNGLRSVLAAAHPSLAPIAKQRGLFALLPVTSAAIAKMRSDHGIYMANDGRINIAGLRLDTIPAFIAGLAPHLQ